MEGKGFTWSYEGNQNSQKTSLVNHTQSCKYVNRELVVNSVYNIEGKTKFVQKA